MFIVPVFCDTSTYFPCYNLISREEVSVLRFDILVCPCKPKVIPVAKTYALLSTDIHVNISLAEVESVQMSYLDTKIHFYFPLYGVQLAYSHLP